MIDIPSHLMDQVKLGNVVLFLGAAASYGASVGYELRNSNHQDYALRRFYLKNGILTYGN